MRMITDFHIHSKYSYATSTYMDLPLLAVWGQLKGISVMGTGDFTHPAWQKEVEELLEPAEQGLFALRPAVRPQVESLVYPSCKGLQRFMLSAEISTIFKRAGKVRKVHSLVLAPDLEAVKKITSKLEKVGNLTADGRPILSLDVKDLLALVLEVSSDCMLIPAHIWTPHFGLLGAHGGFQTVEECFGELLPYIYAFEKGLSSSFLMNAQCSQLDRFAIVANSDGHSVQNLGREANLMDVQLSYTGITKALRNNNPLELLAGIEFFPERGKYFADGHRLCQFYALHDQSSLLNGLCGVCHKKMTIGVAHRLHLLADRSVEQAQKVVRKSLQVVPLLDIIAQVIGTASTSKKVQAMYYHMLELIGNEFYILLYAPVEQIAQSSNLAIAHCIAQLRAHKVRVSPGYDGQYGKVFFD